MMVTQGKQHQFTDASGFRAFSKGTLGEAHARAHELLDAGRHQQGYEFLVGWLEGREGEGSQWTHLQWHLAVFEIATGRVEAALERYREHIEHAVEDGLAATDGPSLLWRLAFAGVERERLDWDGVAEAAHLESRGSSAYTELHHALAFAGSGDLGSLDRWLDRHLTQWRSSKPSTLLAIGWALRAFANGDFKAASRLLNHATADINRLGGSAGQNSLFRQIAGAAAEFAESGAPSPQLT